MGQPRRAEPDLRDFQPVADTEQNVFVGDFKAVEFELAMAAVLLRTHDADAADDAPARLVAVIEKRGEPAALVVGGARDDDEMRRFRRAGDEPFAAADHPFAVFLLGKVRIMAGSEPPPGAGSVMAKDDLLCPPPPAAATIPSARGCRCATEIHVAVVRRRAVDRERAE